MLFLPEKRHLDKYSTLTTIMNMFAWAEVFTCKVLEVYNQMCESNVFFKGGGRTGKGTERDDDEMSFIAFMESDIARDYVELHVK